MYAVNFVDIDHDLDAGSTRWVQDYAPRVARRKLPRHLTWLEAFVAAVETGSLEAAARHLGLVRSVVSEHLRALEEAVAEGQPLLERSPGRRLSLTAQGEKLYAAAHGPLHQLELRRLNDLASPDPSLRL